MTRTDIHSPSSLVPEDYRCVFTGDNQNKPLFTEYARSLVARFSDIGKGRGIRQCHHCGASIRYFGLLEHLPTGDIIAVGETCMSRFDLSSSEFHTMRKAAELDRQAQRIKKLVAEFLELHPDLAWMITDPTQYGNSFLADVARRLRQYGNISAKQVEAVRKAVDRINEMESQEEEITVPVLVGKQTITGTVLSTKYVENQYGGQLKMLVKDDRGFKVWGSVPRSLTDGTDGFYQPLDNQTLVRFTATIEASNDDPTFGFFKRPTKAEKV